MLAHYTVLAECDRQRREQAAAGVAASRRQRPERRRRWWERDHLHHPVTQPIAAPHTRPVATA
jgi:hypothetical protein